MRNSPGPASVAVVGQFLSTYFPKAELFSTFIFTSSGISDFSILNSMLKSSRSYLYLGESKVFLESHNNLSHLHTLNSETVLQTVV